MTLALATLYATGVNTKRFVYLIRWDLTAISTRVHNIKQIAIPNEMANEEAPISLSREVHQKSEHDKILKLGAER